jgi:ParB family chromosome partitioning protein
MTERGVLTPLTVRALYGGSYEIISGIRRYYAAKSAGFMFLPCILINCDDITSMLISLCENTHRKTLHYLEYAEQIEILRNK